MTEHNAGVSKALEEWVAGLPFEGDGDIGILGEWIAVVTMVTVDSEGDPKVEYYLAMRNGTLLPHIATGLLHEGLDQARRMRQGYSDED